MADGIAVFATIAAALFVVELADKDALLILAFASRMKPVRVFLAGSLAFLMTTTVIVAFGTVLITVLPILWIKVAGGAVMFGYGAFLAARIAKSRPVGVSEEDPGGRYSGKGFLAMAGSLALLDLAGDATEVLIIVFLARYADPFLVFSASLVGLVAATAVETAVGNALGRVLTQGRLVVLSACIFLALGAYILLSSA